MIYTALTISVSGAQTVAFSQRGINGLTQGKMSDLPLIGKADERQLAFDGYKANIDAFIAATANNKKVKSNSANLSIPDSYTPQFPLARPGVMFRTPVDSPSYLTKLKETFKAFNPLEHVAGKGPKVLSLDNPSFTLLKKTILKVSKGNSPAPYPYCNADASHHAMILYQCIDAFLATNTYPYSRGDEAMDVDAPFTQPYGYEYLDEDVEYEDTQELLNYKMKRARFDDGTMDDEEKAQFNHNLEEEVKVPRRMKTFTEVMSCKPSPLPSSTCWGHPGDVPYLPGLLFPYFHGLLAPDAAFIRKSASSYFFRNFGTGGTNTRDNYAKFRSCIASFGNTPEGLAMTHILKGVELALDTQTVLYLIFDEEKYLGFCLLGAKFHIKFYGDWVGPLSAAELRAEVETLESHEGTLDRFLKLFSEAPRADISEPPTKIGEIGTSLKLMRELGRLDYTKFDQAAYDELSAMLGKLSFPSKFKGPGLETFVWAIEEMTVRRDEPLGDNVNVYIPSSGYSDFKNKEFQVLCAFGPRAPSWVSASGKEYQIPSPSSRDTLSEVDNKGAMIMPSIVVSFKPPSVAYNDWCSVVRNCRIRFDLSERAANSRAAKFSKDGRDKMWLALKMGMEAVKHLRREGQEKDSGKGKKKEEDITKTAYTVDDLHELEV
jgi:hypothetical protein